jgi:DNA-binding response OmpR family regulator
MFRAYVLTMDVALIRWPSDEPLRLELAELRHPRLLLVEPDADPPDVSDVLEDWVRLPVPRDDRNARVRALEARATGAAPPVPFLAAGDTLQYRDATTQLSEIQAALVAPMIERFGAVVSRESLIATVWPEGDATANKLDVSVSRLRRQLHSVGLRVRTVRARGYVLCDAQTAR